ncbi:cytochrome P450, partial [Erythrobacter sp. YJ-T3-07]|uniref:cytochrome P450 n=1 Tax=Erythrobacter sp. YJ-T3-07 TaxID=2793063 RepID=UPI0018D35917|nr:cytochrome P450 [Erythrobacter sp. YJ-T3-07]
MNRKKDVFGQDVDTFRPERWLRDDQSESEVAYQLRLKRMKDADFSFGAGSRVCVGKFSAQMQILKTLATLFSRYNVSPSSLVVRTR